MQTLQASSWWRHRTEGDTTYILKRTTDKDVIKFVVSDLVHVWLKESSEREILHVFQEMNPLIEFKDEAIIQNIWSLMDTFSEPKDQEKLSCSFHIEVMEEGSLQLKFRTIIDGIAFKFCVTLTQESPQAFFKEVTGPFLAMANELLARQDLLCNLLEKKDLEISQYKLEGATLSRQNVETKVFNKADFVNNCNLRERNSYGLCKVLDIVNLLFTRDPISCEDACPVRRTIVSDKKPDQMSAPVSSSSEPGSDTVCKQDTDSDKAASVSKPFKKKRQMLNL